jgi:hypothetical protein
MHHRLRRRPCLRLGRVTRRVVYGRRAAVRKQDGDENRATATGACRCMNWLILFGMLFFSSLGTGATSTNACAVSLFALSLNRNCGVGNLKAPRHLIYNTFLSTAVLSLHNRFILTRSLAGLSSRMEDQVWTALQGESVHAMFAAQNIKLA